MDAVRLPDWHRTTAVDLCISKVMPIAPTSLAWNVNLFAVPHKWMALKLESNTIQALDDSNCAKACDTAECTGEKADPWKDDILDIAHPVGLMNALLHFWMGDGHYLYNNIM